MRKDDLKELLDQYVTGSITEAGKKQLSLILQDEEQRKLIEEIMEQSFREGWYTAEENKNIHLAIHHFLSENIAAQQQVKKLPGSVRSLTPWLVAASILIIISLSIFTIYNRRTEKVLTIQNEDTLQDVEPGKKGAVLTLADNTQIELDGGKITIPQQGNADISNKNGTLSYRGNSDGSGTLYYNTLLTPKGKNYELQLSDGSKVWLNAASSIKFPVVFSGKERKVEVNGEVYFEVAENKQKPFKVTVKGVTVEVLGTHFNINAYDNQSAVKTTLLAGAVKVSSVGKAVQLVPGQQAVADEKMNMSVVKDVDLDQMIAWKNGHFYFDNASLSEILKEFERWYDIEVVYKNKIPDSRYFAIVNRNSTLASVIKALQATDVHFKIEGKKLMVESR